MSVDVARDNLSRYGEYPLAMTFAKNDHVIGLKESEKQAYSAAFDPHDATKRHAACDECRKRKLKCSGEPIGCARCTKQKLICHYSEQKQMGRPRKRQKSAGDDDIPTQNKQHAHPARLLIPAPTKSVVAQYSAIDPALATVNNERSQFENICNAPMAQTVRTQSQRKTSYQDMPALQSGNSDSSHDQNGIPTPDVFDAIPAYPTDVAQWPDFSTMDILPLPVEDKWRGGTQPDSVESLDPDVNPDALNNLPLVPACPCLPNLYLTLSTLSTLSSYPFTPQTINTIESGYKTAEGVIYCNVCPQKFDTGSSNLMLGTTLLNVLADQWNRFRRLDLDALRKSFGVPEQQKPFLTTKDGQQWRQFSRNMIHAYVFGDQPIPTPPSATANVGTPESAAGNVQAGRKPALTLLSLSESLNRRQRQWHRLEEPTDEFCDRVTPDLAHGHMVGEGESGQGKYLCLEIVNHTKCLIDKLNEPFLH